MQSFRDDDFGDRRQELVFIGRDMDRAWIEASLDAALVPETAFAPAHCSHAADPFPAWRMASAEEVA